MRCVINVPVRGTTSDICGTETIGCQCCGTLRSQETWERVGQWGGYTYYRSGRHLEGVALAVADRQVPMINEVTPVNASIMRQNYKYSGCHFSGHCVSSDWNKRILREGSLLRPASDGSGLVSQEGYLDRPG